MLRFGIGMCLCVALVACSGSKGGSAGPDESNVETFRPLVIPATNALPVPTPGGTNLADMPPRTAPVAMIDLHPPV
jgi:hypothetical protein|tara:strand:- start:114 stop:341 length:228 start_codon:yes stop_codon:yes gene_type:complete